MKRYLLGILLLISSVSLKGQSWQNVGGGTNSGIEGLGVFNNSLYVGGDFTSAGGISASCIAQWNGTNWDSVGAGVVLSSGGGVNGFFAFDSTLYIGGQFSTMGHLPCHSIGQWNGTKYDTVGCGLTKFMVLM